jgi:hypothetical protein
MSGIRFSSTFLLCTAVVSGCVPVTIEEIPAVHGVVHDDSTNAPISGAKIVVKQITQSEFEANAMSDSSGHFQTDKVAHHAWVPLGYDLLVPDPQIEVSAAGYVKLDEALHKLGSASGEMELRLTPSDQDH